MQEIDIGVDWESPLSQEQPAGPDMQYAPEFAELEVAATGTSEQEYGDVLIAAKGPDWRQVFELAAKLSRQTHDLRVLLLMSRALTRLHGLPGLLSGLQALNGVLRHQWDHVHPQLAVDGIDDPHVRFGVLSEFAAPDGLAGDARQAIAFPTPLGELTVRDLERLAEQGGVELNGITISRDQIDEMVRDLRRSGEAAVLDLPSRLVELLNGLLRHIEERAGSEFTPDWANLKRSLERASSVLGDSALAATDESPEGTDASSPASAASMAALGALNSRADVVRAMDAICAYLERHEPTNPAPLLVRRARRLMTMNFLDIIKDMSPDGINQVLLIAGSEAEEGSAGS
ncbi:MAG: type VI secretion system protein TssA [Burkholderiaceae bacterium]|jgi:type VI secretion system protein ImpA|nr:type VI secretion system protein TssA [Burkholderiaceae bacterium]